ncbi:MAG: hypothetical protein NVSMB46_00280 [Candidatus Saccharimonadales bacterium]
MSEYPKNASSRYNKSGNLEQPTFNRYSLVNGVITEDFILRHPSGTSRILSYPKQKGQSERYRKKLVSKDVVLGTYQDVARSNTEYVRIPKSSRPLGYDSSTNAEGAFTYDDKKLFYELGELLGAINDIKPSKNLIVEGELDNKIAIVEFTHPNQRSIYFIPGIECWLNEVDREINPLNYYMSQLDMTYANRFADAAVYFESGYAASAHTSM